MLFMQAHPNTDKPSVRLSVYCGMTFFLDAGGLVWNVCKFLFGKQLHHGFAQILDVPRF